MKALIITDNDTTSLQISRRILPWGFDCIHYKNAIKALDNIPEIAPDAVFINTSDFPRHWKAIVQFIRADTKKDETVIVLLINNRFTAEDADKAVHIGVQAIVSEDFSSNEDERRLTEVFSRYIVLPTDSAQYAELPNPVTTNFLFSHPTHNTIITGKIERISLTGLRFMPDAPSSTADLAKGEILSKCTLKIDSQIFQIQCLISRNTHALMLDFVKPSQPLSTALSTLIAEKK